MPLPIADTIINYTEHQRVLPPVLSIQAPQKTRCSSSQVRHGHKYYTVVILCYKSKQETLSPSSVFVEAFLNHFRRIMAGNDFCPSLSGTRS